MATLPDAYDELLANALRQRHIDAPAGDTGNLWFMLHTADPGDTGASPVTGLSRTAIARNEVQTLSITGSPTGGTFTLTFGAQTTAAIAYNASAADVENALNALSSIINPSGDWSTIGSVKCAGGPLPGSAITIEFYRALGQASQALITSTDSLTGGTAPATSIVETVDGFDLLGAYADDATSGGRLADNSALIALGTASAGETATHGALWTASTGGTMIISKALVANVTYSNGQNVEIAAGALDIFGAGYP